MFLPCSELIGIAKKNPRSPSHWQNVNYSGRLAAKSSHLVKKGTVLNEGVSTDFPESKKTGKLSILAQTNQLRNMPEGLSVSGTTENRARKRRCSHKLLQKLEPVKWERFA